MKFIMYEVMMELTEQIILDALAATGQRHKVEWNEKEIDFTPPFARRKYNDLFAEHTGLDPSDSDAIAKYAKTIGVDPTGKHPDVVKSEVFEEKVEDNLIGPVSSSITQPVSAR